MNLPMMSIITNVLIPYLSSIVLAFKLCGFSAGSVIQVQVVNKGVKIALWAECANAHLSLQRD